MMVVGQPITDHKLKLNLGKMKWFLESYIYPLYQKKAVNAIGWVGLPTAF